MSYCEILGCNNKTTHVSSMHKCVKCKNTGHGIYDCLDQKSVKVANDLVDKKIPTVFHCSKSECSNPWTHLTVYHKCENCNKNHSITECKNVILKKKVINIICPLCRVENIFLKYFNVVGSENLCCICSDKTANVYLPSCGHNIICKSCCNRINRNNNENIVSQTELPHAVIQMVTSIFANKIGKIYTIINVGLGNMYYVKQDSIDSDLVGYLMYSDSWNDINITDLYQFIYNYSFIKCNIYDPFSIVQFLI
tara:strand:+ start:107 stop:862 length:756 start_codon:yes stop_codon:yes gene_type:complete